jgi:uncharacterized membrane-anchored protein
VVGARGCLRFEWLRKESSPLLLLVRMQATGKRVVDATVVIKVAVIEKEER